MAMNKVPTLLIGLGGIGCSIADIASRMIGEEEKKYVGFLGFDTNVEDLKKLSIKSVRTSDERLVKDYLERHPEYTKWFPVNKIIANRGMLTGAGQVRAISRLAALAAIEEGRFIPLEEEIKRILKKTGDKDTSAFNVFFVGSITGGTGAGLFLQMPYFIRNLLKKEYATTNVRIRGMFISADITKNVQPSRINRDAVMVNAYTCIKELNAFYQTQNIKDEDNLLELEYYEKKNKHDKEEELRKSFLNSDLYADDGFDLMDGEDMGQLRKDISGLASEGANIPYDAFYLIEGTDRMGTTGLEALDKIKEQIAKMLFTLLFTPVKAEDAGVGDNFVLKDMEGGGMDRYSSAGMCCIKYPYEQVREYVTLRWIQDLVSKEWLYIDDKYLEEKKEAQARLKSDPTVKIPKVESRYIELFDYETGGKPGTTLGKLRRDGYDETDNKAKPEVSKAAFIVNAINTQIERLFSENEEIMNLKDSCAIAYKEMANVETARKEISRVTGELEELEKVVKNTVNSSRYEIANAVFPTSMDSLKMRENSELCIYKRIADIHPVAARFVCYSLIREFDKQIKVLRGVLEGLDLNAFEDENYGTDKGKMGVNEAIVDLQNKQVPIVKTGKKPLRSLTGKFSQNVEAQIDAIMEFGKNSIMLDTYCLLRERFEKLAEYYEVFFRNIREAIKNNDERIDTLERSFMEHPFGVINVYSKPESFDAIYREFKTVAEFELPSDTKKAIFKGVFSEVCDVFEDKNKDLSELEKQDRDERSRRNLEGLFTAGVVDTLRTIVVKKGRGIVDMTIQQAIEKEYQQVNNIRRDNSERYEEGRIAYERELVENALRIAAPMFAVSGEEDIAIINYLAIHPESAEKSEGSPSKTVTKNHLVPERCEATDNQSVCVLMESEFSKYEIVCLKTRHKYKVEDLVKYRADSEYAAAYRARISNLGKLPIEEGDEAYKTVINPHLNRYWHEEGFVPSLGMKNKEAARKNIVKAFIYAMGMDTFIRTRYEDDVRDYWYLVSGARALKVFSKGHAIGNGYVDLYNALFFNGKWTKYVMDLARIRTEKMKASLDADEMMDKIHMTTLIEDLIQSKEGEITLDKPKAQKTQASGLLFFDDSLESDSVEEDDFDENILDIFLKMYTKMSEEKWAELFEGLKLVLHEYLAIMFDRNVRLINQAYQSILNRMFTYSLPGRKMAERQYCVQNGLQPTADLDLTIAEKKLRAHIQEIYKETYFG